MSYLRTFEGDPTADPGCYNQAVLRRVLNLDCPRGARFQERYRTRDMAFNTPVRQHGTYSWHTALTAEDKHRGPAKPGRSPVVSCRCGVDGTSPDSHPPRTRTRPRRGHLLGVGAVPEDGVAVGHHFGTGLLAEYAHQQQHADEKDHFHLQHHYSATSARIPLLRRVKSSRVGRFNRDR